MSSLARLAGLSLVALVACGSPAGGDPTGSSSEALVVATGVDYAWARPSPSGLKSGGYTFACRYLSHDTTGKNLSSSEASSLWAAGVDVVVVWEDSATAALNGYSQGVTDATDADAQAKSDGGPSGRPIYFAVDFDAQPGDMASIEAYFNGVASVIGLARTGVYAGYAATNDLFGKNKITWGWQTYAWSYGSWDTRAQLRQVLNGITAAGDSNCCDEDQAVASDYGQWHAALDYAAQFVSQSFPYASTTMTMTAGEVIPSYIELKNTGTKTWDSNTHLGTTMPRDRTSAFADSTWLSANRPSGVKGTVAPGATYKFTFDLAAPETPGTYDEHFGVVEDGVAWFSDKGQGGPPDNQLEVKIQVLPGDGGVPPVKDGGTPADDAGLVTKDDAGNVITPDGGDALPSTGGCSLGPAPQQGNASLAGLLLGLGLTLRRRRPR